MIKKEVTKEEIEYFLNGRDPQKYIVAIEAPYHENEVSLIINDPETGKRIEQHSYKPFVWIKHDVTQLLYGGKRRVLIDAMNKYGVKIKGLNVADVNGYIPPRLERGFKFMATTKLTYNHLVNFFKEGGVDMFDMQFSKLFVSFSPAEQFLIQSGKRLFKGFDDYNDVHRLQFDLETEGLDARVHAIFQIGIRDNRGYEMVLETLGDTQQEKRDSERNNIIEFFNVINQLRPDIITAYNSENFDWPYIFSRCERLSIDITEIAKTLSNSKIRRKQSTLKLGGDTEHYEQTHMWGYNIVDISHPVRRAQAINSEIKSWSLKYITKFSGVAKPNRVYVQGDRIHATWNDKINDYAFNDTNGDYHRITEKNPLKEGYNVVKGDYIVQRYLLDDLWETEQIDTIYSQASFLLAKIIPTSYVRSSTMGTAGTWKLIMAAWSYENDLGIPDTEPKRDFTGGLSRLLEVGYARNVGKVDFAALYPKTQLTWDIFPDLDISGVMKSLLTYVVDTRDESKFLVGKYKDKAKKLQAYLDDNPIELTSAERIKEIKEEITKYKALASLYDKKQLPLKILANSWFGAYGAPYIFNWGDTDCAEETTCRGRQSLRFMVKFFVEKYKFRPLVLDTDGVNFAIPDDIDNVKYIAKGNHWKTEGQTGVELIGIEAVLAEFNEEHMIGRMGLDIDDICNSTINFARKNYANDIDGKIKLVGNTIKSKKMPTYIEEFLNTGIRFLLDGKGHEFVEYYYEYVDKIYNYQIPIAKIASKGKVKISVKEYKKKATMKNKAGNPLPKQAHMELVLQEGLEPNLGDVIYYVNTGTSKSDGDIKTIKDKTTGKSETKIFCKLISTEQLENDPDLTTDEYNVVKYLDAFNKRIKPLLVCFDREIRNKILITIKKDRKTKTEKLETRSYFTHAQCGLVAGQPNEPKDQDRYIEDLMVMEDKEIKFWVKVNKVPNFMDENEWEAIKIDYLERLIKEKEEGIVFEKEQLNEVFKRLSVTDFNDMKTTGILPIEVLQIVDLDENNDFISRKYNEIIWPISKMVSYEKEAIAREVFYETLEDGLEEEEKYEKWLNYKDEKLIMTGKTFDDGIQIECEPEVSVKESETNKTEIEKPDIKPIENEVEDEWNF